MFKHPQSLRGYKLIVAYRHGKRVYLKWSTRLSHKKTRSTLIMNTTNVSLTKLKAALEKIARIATIYLQRRANRISYLKRDQESVYQNYLTRVSHELRR